MTPQQRSRLHQILVERGYPVVPLQPDHAVDLDWPAGQFRCDSAACERICCAVPTVHRGIPLSLADLELLAAGDLLDSVAGQTLTSADAAALLANHRAVAEWRRVELAAPRLRKSGGRCVHHHSREGRCTIYPHRPRVCRSFPYELDRRHEVPRFTMSVVCSLVSTYGWHGRAQEPPPDLAIEEAPRWPPSDEARAPRWRRVRCGDLPAGERIQLDHSCARDVEELETYAALAEEPQLFDELGLGRYRAP